MYRLNEVAWRYFARSDQLVMAIGSDATPDEIIQAMCSDVANGSGTQVIETTTYEISALYYGWKIWHRHSRTESGISSESAMPRSLIATGLIRERP